MEKEIKKQECCLATCDKDIICYRGHIIYVHKVYIRLDEYDKDGNEQFVRIDKVIKT